MTSHAADGYYDLGTYSRPVTTSSAAAQRWFDRGLLWCYGFNHEEAIRCFLRAAAADPACVMAHWGVAYAAGCNYNKPWEAFLEEELRQALATAADGLARARAGLDRASPVERALVEGLATRYPADPGATRTFHAWNDAYADAMRRVYAAHPDDLDVAALFAEALINRTPWKLWDLPGRRPADGASTVEAVEVLERALRRVEHDGDPHPGLLHVYVHTMEMSPYPERALRAADALRDLVPDAGHLRHMPSHIDVLCGHYHEAVVANRRAIEADARYAAREGPVNFYTLYRCHDYHFLLYAAMFLAQARTAVRAARDLAAAIPEALLRVEVPPMADWLEGFVPMVMHAFIRFGRWEEILAEPLPADRSLYCVTTAVQRYARGLAYAATGRLAEAGDERERFVEAAAQVPETRYLFNNRCTDILTVAAAMLDGELEYRRGNVERAFAHLRRAVDLDDGLPYDEPWAWMQPARHALGALLLEQGRVADAEWVYRDDLGLTDTLSRAAQHPDNVWSLHGLVECLHRQHRHAEATMMERRLALAAARADVPIPASCYCRLEVAPSRDGATPGSVPSPAPPT